MNLDVSHIFLIFFFLLIQRPLISTLFPYTTLFRSIDPGLVHLANSAAIVSRPETWADMVRPGAILYGYHPGYDPAEKRAEAEKLLPLEPVMSLHTKIIHLRRVPAGAGVGYDATFVPKRP